MAKQSWLSIDGVVLLDKPLGLSSNAALQKVRRAYRANKGGHTGTLDPLATGLLPLCLGEATKFSQMLLDADKAYAARVRLGETSTTGDAEGEILFRSEIRPTEGEIDAVLPRFLGEIDQVPPMYSALKRDGKPLYEYARQGVELERSARRVTILSLTRGPLDGQEFDLTVRCSKGTYIRTLAEDIGEALGCGAHITALRRTQIGPFRVEDAVCLDALEQDSSARAEALLAVDLLAGHLPVFELNDAQACCFSHGQQVFLSDPRLGQARIYGGGRFIGLGRCDAPGLLVPVRLVAERFVCAPRLDVQENSPL